MVATMTTPNNNIVITPPRFASIRFIGLIGSALTFVLGVTYVIWRLCDVNYSVGHCRGLDNNAKADCNSPYRVVFPLDLMQLLTVWGPIMIGVWGIYSAFLGTGWALDPFRTVYRACGFHIFMALFANLGYAWIVGFIIGLVNLVIGAIELGVILFYTCVKRQKIETIGEAPGIHAQTGNATTNYNPSATTYSPGTTNYTSTYTAGANYSNSPPTNMVNPASVIPTSVNPMRGVVRTYDTPIVSIEPVAAAVETV